MRKILSILTVLVTLLWGCDTLDLSDVGYGDANRLKSSTVKNLLYGTADGCWMATYQNHEFYFQFHEDGTVTLDSEFLEQAVKGTTTFGTSGTSVGLTIENCDVHLKKVGNAYAETSFIISEIPDEGETVKVSLKGQTNGNVIELVPTTLTYINEQTASKADFNELFASNMLDNQVICNSEGKVLGYYGLTLKSVADISIKVLMLENRTGEDVKGHVQYYESTLTKVDKVFSLESPIRGIMSVDGNTYAFNAIDCSGSAITVDGMSGVILSSNKGAVNYFDYTSGKKFSMNNKQGWGDACDEIWEETGVGYNNSEFQGIPYNDIHLEGIDAMKYDKVDSSTRPLAIWRDWYKNIVYPSSEPGASILMNSEDNDWIIFKNSSGAGLYEGMGYMGYDSSVEECIKIKEACNDLIGTWFNEKGLFVVRVPNENAVLLLCPDVSATEYGGMWMKWEENR